MKASVKSKVLRKHCSWSTECLSDSEVLNYWLTVKNLEPGYGKVRAYIEKDGQIDLRR